MDKIQMELFEQLTGLHEIPAGAYTVSYTHLTLPTSYGV